MLAEAGRSKGVRNIHQRLCQLFPCNLAGAGMQSASCDLAALAAALKVLNRALPNTAPKAATPDACRRLWRCSAFGRDHGGLHGAGCPFGADARGERGFLLQEGNARMAAAGLQRISGCC